MGGGCFNLPTIYSLGRECFIDKYMARCSFVKDERKRLIYLSEVWKQAEKLMKKQETKKIKIPVTDPETLTNALDQGPVKKTSGRSRARKNQNTQE